MHLSHSPTMGGQRFTGPIVAAALASALFAAAPMGGAEAEVLVPVANIPVGVIIEREHVAVARGSARPGELELPEEAIGLAARATLYKGRPIRAENLGPPIVVRRNSFVTIEFRRGGLLLRTEGRALDDGAIGDRIRVMNLDSRRTIFGVIVGERLVEVK